jgi:hypothetical protein
MSIKKINIEKNIKVRERGHLVWSRLGLRRSPCQQSANGQGRWCEVHATRPEPVRRVTPVLHATGAG